MLGNRNSAIEHRESREGGFAILMVVLVLVCLAIIGAPFAISMRQEEQASITFSARVRAKLAAQAALSFAIAQLEETHEDYERRYAEGGQSTMHNSPYVDSNGEFRVDLQDPLLNGMETAKPTGVMWGVRVTDEQGKINLKTASGALLFNLARQFFGDTRGQAIATAIIQYRDDPTQRHQFTALTQLREITIAGTPPRLGAAEYDRMAPFLTVHSASLVGEVPSGSPALHPVHPVNINTCSEEVLRALLRGVRLADQNDGQPAHTGVSDTPENPEVDRLIARLRVLSRLEKRVAKGDTSLTVSMADPSGKFPVSGWVSVEGDAVKYAAVEYTNDIDRVLAKFTVSTQGTDPIAGRVDDDHPHVDKSNPKYIETPLDQVEVRLLFTDVEHDLAGLLDAMVNPPSPQAQQLSPESRSAILANAINPRNGAALDQLKSTAPFCFSSFNIYTIEAHGISSAPDGRELARYTIREVAQVAPMGNLEIKIDTQEDFERSRQAGIASHVATWPNATQASDIPPSNFEPTEVYRHGRLGLQAAEYSPAGETTFVARFNGPLKRNTLRGENPPEEPGAKTNLPDPVSLTGFPSVKVEPGDDSDLEPEGIHVGEVADQATGKPISRRVLVYPARNDTDPGKSNIPQGADYIQPFVIEMWVKFDSKDKFDYSRDHFLLDLAEATFTNRVALYYDSTGPTGGDLVLHVCDPTLQPTPAQVRCPITADTFEPQRWYHLAVVVKGSDYGQMALLIDGAPGVRDSNGVLQAARYEPSALLASDGGASLGCDRLAPYDGPDYFAAYTWPQEDCVIVDGELIEHVAASSNALTVRATPFGRGARGTLYPPAGHGVGAHVELYGYDDQVVPARDDTLLPPTMDHVPRGAEVPIILGTEKIPATMALATVNDGFDGTAASSTAYWKPNTDPKTGYAAASLSTSNEIPADGWLPLAHSDPWDIKKGGTVADVEATFKKVAEDTTFLPFLSFTGGNSLSTSTHSIEDTQNGFGFFRVEGNPGVTDGAGEEIKYAKAGVVLVWRWHPDDLGLKEEDRRKKAWYIGYLANFGDDAGTMTYARRACFGTTKKDINEGAMLRFDCVRLSSFEGLPRGRRGPKPWPPPPPGGGPPPLPPPEYNGLGIFQLYRDKDIYEWVQFTYPQYDAKDDELKLVAGVGSAFLVGINRSTCGTGPTPATPDAHVGYEFVAGDKVMPVLFGGGSVSSRDDQYLPIIKGPGDRVTLTDRTDLREEKYVSHGNAHYFAFRDQVAGSFPFNLKLGPNVIRVLKFPSGSLPLRPDTRVYIGSDSTAFGDQDPFTGKTYNGASPLTDPAEPERPANATFDEIKIYPSSGHPTARLWDYKKTAGPPDENRPQRGLTTIAEGDQPPFYLRIGRLERLTMRPEVKDPKNLPPNPEPFRFVIGGEVDWPMEGYAKIDDEVFFYRKMFYNRKGGHSAAIVSDRTAGADGLAVALTTADTEVYVDAKDGDDFPERGYISIGGSWPNLNEWKKLVNTANFYSIDPVVFWKGYGGQFGLHSSVGAPERAFFQRGERTTKNGKDVWRLQLELVNRGIVDTDPCEVKLVPDGTTPDGFVPGATERGGGSVSVIGIEFLILQRECLGTTKAAHRIGTVLMPLDHIPTSLTPRPLIHLKREANGSLPRVVGKPDTIRPLRLGDPRYDPANFSRRPDDPLYDPKKLNITQEGCEYGIVLEDADQFPAEGYVQIGNEIFAYVQDRDGANPLIPNSGTPVWKGEVLVYDYAQDTNSVPVKDDPNYQPVPNVLKILPVLTGIRDFRQRFGSGRAVYMEKVPGDSGALKCVDPGIPDPNKPPGDAGYKTQPTPAYWGQTAKHLVRLLHFRYHDRFPIHPASAPADTDPSGGYGPHWNDTDLGYYEFAVTLPGARWTSVNWAEALWRKPNNTWVLDNTPLDPGNTKDPKKDPGDPFDVKVLAQIDGTPGWDDMTMDPTLSLLDEDGMNVVAPSPQPVSSPIYWSNFSKVTGAYTDDATSHRPRKPVIFLFDSPIPPPTKKKGPVGNYINPITGNPDPQPRGQYGDRIRLRVFFQYKRNLNDDRDNSEKVPFYQIPWRTPWVDWITIGYRAPTYVMEHREMPY